MKTQKQKTVIYTSEKTNAIMQLSREEAERLFGYRPSVGWSEPPLAGEAPRAEPPQDRTAEDVRNWHEAQARAKLGKKVWAFINLGIAAFILRIAYELAVYLF